MSKTLDDILSTANAHGIQRLHNAKVAEESHIFNFIKDNDVKEGSAALPVRFIYALYCEQNRPGIKRRRFSMYFKLFFRKRITGAKTYYRLDPTPFNIPQNYTIWKEQGQKRWKYKKTKYNNIKSTPEGWMVYLEVKGGRQVYAFMGSEPKAALAADRVTWFFYGPNYTKFNFPKEVINFKETDLELLELLTLEKDAYDKTSKKEIV